VIVDDKLRILDAMARVRGGRLNTVFAQKGHHAMDSQNLSAYPRSDIQAARIGAFANYSLGDLAR
jgi:hypothetical protein